MAHHDFTTPLTEAQARALRVNDTVTLRGTLFGIRDATQIHMFDRGRKTRFDLRGHAVIHTAPNVRKTPTGYEPICVGTTTSRSHGALHRAAHARVRRAPGHRQGRAARGFIKAFKEFGGAYLAIIGGTAALETTWIEAIEDVDLDDLHPGVALEVPCQRFRALARCHGQPRREPLCRGEHRGAAQKSRGVEALGRTVEFPKNLGGVE